MSAKPDRSLNFDQHARLDVWLSVLETSLPSAVLPTPILATSDQNALLYFLQMVDETPAAGHPRCHHQPARRGDLFGGHHPIRWLWRVAGQRADSGGLATTQAMKPGSGLRKHRRATQPGNQPGMCCHRLVSQGHPLWIGTVSPISPMPGAIVFGGEGTQPLRATAGRGWQAFGSHAAAALKTVTPFFGPPVFRPPKRRKLIFWHGPWPGEGQGIPGSQARGHCCLKPGCQSTV